VWSNGGKFDSWQEHFRFDLWEKAFAKFNIDPNRYTTEIALTTPLPWDHIDLGITKDFLVSEYNKAMTATPLPPCSKLKGQTTHASSTQEHLSLFGEAKNNLVCYGCGVKCDLKATKDERYKFLKDIEQYNQTPSTRIKQPHATGSKYKFRVEFAKLGAIALLSGLDIQKIIARIFKRAKIDVAHSLGHHPRPIISFGPPLALGISSLQELFDFVTDNPEDPESILKKLQQSSECGIIFKSISAISLKSASIQETYVGADYFFPLLNTQNPENVKQTVAAVLSSSTASVKSFYAKKNIFVDKDIRPMIENIELSTIKISQNEQLLLEEFTPNLLGVGLIVRTRNVDERSTKPSELKSLFSEHQILCSTPVKLSSLLG